MQVPNSSGCRSDILGKLLYILVLSRFRIDVDPSKHRERRSEVVSASLEIALERLSTGWIHPVDKKSLQIQKLEHILVAQIYPI
jgi:hypothetical protein